LASAIATEINRMECNAAVSTLALATQLSLRSSEFKDIFVVAGTAYLGQMGYVRRRKEHNASFVVERYLRCGHLLIKRFSNGVADLLVRHAW
jgi:hypothetical protein